ncbi:Osteocrin [Collichthys lucidus]|uniref:Osteocrin n=1 Tax=Collichthys lucidus TaxID=240159 RepID=A0A4U5TV46_COLLU|nr:Osteocrin [Collichthys lucidus]
MLAAGAMMSLMSHNIETGGPRPPAEETPCVDRPVSRSSAGLRPRPRGVKMGEELTAKLLRLDELVRMENDVMEPKRKRSFPGNNGPLDRLTVNSMETKQATSKQRWADQNLSCDVITW